MFRAILTAKLFMLFVIERRSAPSWIVLDGVGVERREVRGQITIQGTDKKILKQFKPPLDLQDRHVLRISHTATKRVSATGIYDVVEFGEIRRPSHRRSRTSTVPPGCECPVG